MNYFKHTIARMSYWLMSSWPASYFKGKAMSVKMVSFSIGSERYTSCVFFWSEKWKLRAVREIFYPSSSFRRKRFWYDTMQRRTTYFLAPFFFTWISLLFHQKRRSIFSNINYLVWFPSWEYLSWVYFSSNVETSSYTQTYNNINSTIYLLFLIHTKSSSLYFWTIFSFSGLPSFLHNQVSILVYSIEIEIR